MRASLEGSKTSATSRTAYEKVIGDSTVHSIPPPTSRCESRASEIAINDVRHPIFLALLEYLYTDNVDIALDIAMELFQAADQFGVERLKRMFGGDLGGGMS